MQERKGVRRPAKPLWLQSLFVSRSMILLLLAIIGSSALLYADPSILQRHDSAGQLVEGTTQVLNGANLWVADRKVTGPTFDFSVPGSYEANVSPLFSLYYNRHSGTQSLGAPLTPAFPTNRGWIQFFGSGALLMPGAQWKHIPDANDLQSEDILAELINAGVRDLDTGIIRLPLLQALLTVGSLVPVGVDGSPVTYVDLRKATNPVLMQPGARARHITTSSRNGIQAIFIKGGTRAGKDVGHLIPLPFWRYINRVDISPDGWEQDFGAPLTEALSYTFTRQSIVHRMLVQAFEHDGLVLDQSILDDSSQPQIKRLDTGLDYLRTVGPPIVAINPQQPGWAQGETTLFAAPNMHKAVAHVGQDFPLTLLGDTTWNGGVLWYHAQWTAPKRPGNGWVPASTITLTSPGNTPGWASFDVLSPDLATYLADIGDNVGVVAYDVTGQRYYTYHANTQFLTGSSIKVPIMLAFLDMTEQEGRQPNDYEMALLTTMIENSNNDSAQTLYSDEIGDAVGLASYLGRIGIADLDPSPGTFGWSLITPLAMVNLLTLLHDGKILTASDRDLAFSLMENIESDQQVGVGDTAPTGATVAMKDGWVPGPDGLWAMNSSGIVTLDNETYIIAVYTGEQDTLQDGQAIARHVCATVASLLT